MSAQHTPGRLKVFSAYATPEIRTQDDAFVANTSPYNEANARRLVACWNACDGITDPENVVPRLLVLNELVPNLEHQAATLRVQRDELLTALSRIAKWNEHTTEFAVDFGSNGVRDFYRGIASRAIRAIAKVKGGAA